jgi:fatty-acyl-CoA synthase
MKATMSIFDQDLDPAAGQAEPHRRAVVPPAGESTLHSNMVMKAYLKNPAAAEASHGDWFHIGDLAVMHPVGYAKIKARAKDIIISVGENISLLEVEESSTKI